MRPFQLNMRTVQQRRSIITEYARAVQHYRDKPDIYGPARSFAWQLYYRVCSENVAELVALTTADVLAEVKAELEHAPKTDEDWAKSITINCDKEQDREAIELLREFFASQAERS
jgi:hypothetical protein